MPDPAGSSLEMTSAALQTECNPGQQSAVSRPRSVQAIDGLKDLSAPASWAWM